MKRDLVRDGLRFKLAQRYREDPTHFLSLSKQSVDSSLAREIVAELGMKGTLRKSCAARSGLHRGATERSRTILRPTPTEMNEGTRSRYLACVSQTFTYGCRQRS
jgi:hypothetical protein